MRRPSLVLLLLLPLLPLAVAGCGSGSHSSPGEVKNPPPPPPPPPPVGPPPPVTVGDWTYYGTGQGLGPDVWDVSADEGGNVYVAGGDAVYAKARADAQFKRFDSKNAGLTVNCNDEALKAQQNPTKPFYQCRVLSVAGAAPGKAIIGFDGFETETADTPSWDWVLLGNGGADVVSFDATAGTLSRDRHVDIGSPPHVICTAGGNETRGTTCADPGNGWWVGGRHLLHRVRRIAVNHDPSTAEYGDAWFCGEHATFAALLANSGARGYKDYTAGVDPKYGDEKDVWEHLHPALVPTDNPAGFINAECTALSLDPRDGTPWASNRYRTVAVDGYGPDLHGDNWWMKPGTEATFIDIWPDPSRSTADLNGPSYDDVSTMSHCADGSLWVGSLRHGLARIDTSGAITRLSLPDPSLGNDVTAVACDPTDSSLWIGLGAGGVMRLKNGSFSTVPVTGAPDFAKHPVQSIQIDRWAGTRIIYVAFGQTTPGGSVAAGGIASYAGP